MCLLSPERKLSLGLDLCAATNGWYHFLMSAAKLGSWEIQSRALGKHIGPVPGAASGEGVPQEVRRPGFSGQLPH